MRTNVSDVILGPKNRGGQEVYYCTSHILHHHAQLPLCLKRTKHGDNKWVVCVGEDVPFHQHLLDTCFIGQPLSFDELHGKSLSGLSVAHKVYCPATLETQEA